MEGIVFGAAAVTAVPSLVWLFVLVNRPDWAREPPHEEPAAPARPAI